METHTPMTADEALARARRREQVWKALAIALAVLVFGLIFVAYNQPDLLLNISGLRYCG